MKILGSRRGLDVEFERIAVRADRRLRLPYFNRMGDFFLCNFLVRRKSIFWCSKNNSKTARKSEPPTLFKHTGIFFLPPDPGLAKPGNVAAQSVIFRVKFKSYLATKFFVFKDDGYV